MISTKHKTEANGNVICFVVKYDTNITFDVMMALDG